MAELIGVIDSFSAMRPSFLKRTALLFDRMAIHHFNAGNLDYWLEAHPDESQELLWLMDQQIIFEAKLPTSDVSLDKESVEQQGGLLRRSHTRGSPRQS